MPPVWSMMKAMENTSSRHNATLSRKVAARKSLGQHFLKSKTVLERIRDTADFHSNDIVLEIGPGMGSLTDVILPRVAKLIAIEKDRRLLPLLQGKYQREIQNGKLDLIEEDILAFDPEFLRTYGRSYKVVANIPYYITGAILEKFLTALHEPERIVLLMQKEVADRIVAHRGKESLLSLSVKAYGVPRRIMAIKRTQFRPMPAVDSALVLIEGISRNNFTSRAHEKRFFELIRAGFAHKRKVVRSNLASVGVDLSALPENARAEDLSLETWLTLARS